MVFADLLLTVTVGPTGTPRAASSLPVAYWTRLLCRARSAPALLPARM